MFQIDQLKEKIKKNGVVVGTHVKWPEGNIVELFAMAGYDYIWIDGEHSTLGINDVNSHIRIAQSNNAAAFYRVRCNEPAVVKPILELGPDGIIFPMVCTAEEARRAVAACKYPAAGVRGYAPGRAIKYGLMDLDTYLEETKKIWTIIQIEHIEAVKNLDEILQVPGIDAIVVGMMDLSASLGKLGQVEDPYEMELLDTIAEKTKKAGLPFGVSMGYNPKIVQDWIRRGASLISVGGEEEFLCRMARKTLEEMREFGERDRKSVV